MDYLFNSLLFRQPNRDDIELRNMESRGERELDDMEVTGSASAPYDASLSSNSRSAPCDPLNSGNMSAPYVCRFRCWVNQQFSLLQFFLSPWDFNRTTCFTCHIRTSFPVIVTD